MLIGILQTGQAPDILAPVSGDYPDMFQKLLADQGLSFRTYRVLDMEFPASVAECDGWLITGSRVEESWCTSLRVGTPRSNPPGSPSSRITMQLPLIRSPVYRVLLRALKQKALG